MKKHQKDFAPVLILGVVVVASIALYFIYKNFGVSKLNLNIPYESPSTTTTEIDKKHWKTYTDLRYKFSFDYPVEERNYVSTFEPKLIYIASVGSGLPHLRIEIVETDLSPENWWKTQTSESWLEISSEKFNIYPTYFLEKESFALSLKPDFKDPFSGQKLYLVKHSGVLLKIFISEDEIGDQILSTFKFTN